MTDKNDEFGFDVDAEDADSLSSMDESNESNESNESDESDESNESDERLSVDDEAVINPTVLESPHREVLEHISDSFQTNYSESGKTKASSNLLVIGVAGTVIAFIVGFGVYLLLPNAMGDRGNSSFGSNETLSSQDTRGKDDFSFNQLEAGTDDAALDFSSMEQDDSGNTAAESSSSVAEDMTDNVTSPLVADELYSDIGADSFSDGDVVITDEDRMYDNLLVEASVIDAPHEAIKIDRSVINNELQVKRLGRVEGEIAQTRKDLSDINEVINAIRKQTNDIANSIEGNNAASKQFSVDIKKLSERVDNQIKLQKADITALQIDLKSVKSSDSPIAVAAVAQSVKAAPTKSNAEQDRIVRETMAKANMVKAVNLAAPKPRPVAVRAPAPNTQTSRNCAVTKVSENWRVKGVTPSSAYVERVQDGQGLLLKSGVGLPGFGTVVSFNPTDRSVCTSSGIVRR